MKKHLPWHHTRIGTAVLWLGSIELAVPVLVLTAIALAVGTYLDSTKGAQVAKEAVYGSWWFIATMALVCVSLIFAVFTRYPWKRRHIGFITVHASLLGLIAGGFISLFGRVEGHLPLEEGTSGDVMETQQDLLELVQVNTGQLSVLGSAPGPRGPASLTIGGTKLQIVERWENSREAQIVNDDAPMPFRAVQVAAQVGEEPIWVGEEGKAGDAPVHADLLIRVLPDGGTWEPPAKASQAAAPQGYAFVLNGRQYPLKEEGQEAFPGWKIVSIKRYTRAFVGSDGLIEASGGPENPAIDVAITDGKGTTERHTAFQNFTDMVMNRVVEGAGHSGAKLGPAQAADPLATETLIVYGTIAQTGVGYITPTGEARVLDAAATFPKTFDLGMRRVTIANQFARAKGGWQLLKAEPAKDNRPVLVVRGGDSTQQTLVPFKGMVPITSGDRPMALRYGPRMVPLPFSVRLVDFRKTDYPGTEMAMAYESDVEVTLPGQAATSFRIYMNHPYAHGPWKVYQSGFMGDKLSIFSIMRDPGLPLTYASSALLCIGILITFFSRSLSWGHPGIPVPATAKEPRHVPPVPAAPAPGPVAVLNRPVSTSGV